MAVARQRLDQLLVDRGLAESRAKAQALILSGNVLIGTQRADKPGRQVAADAEITLKGQVHPWVSRGGLKLAHALTHFAVDVSGVRAIDVGASTGGFTDVLLHHGAAKVYAVDVGHGQLDWKLRNDARVVVLEKTNARYLSREQVPEPVDLVVCDASFIGLQTVLPAALALMSGEGQGATTGEAALITLIKPQFEAGREDVGKGGVVRDPALHEAICARIKDWVNAQPGWQVRGLSESPVTGPKGNKEFLLYATKSIGRKKA